MDGLDSMTISAHTQFAVKVIGSFIRKSVLIIPTSGTGPYGPGNVIQSLFLNNTIYDMSTARWQYTMAITDSANAAVAPARLSSSIVDRYQLYSGGNQINIPFQGTGTLSKILTNWTATGEFMSGTAAVAYLGAPAETTVIAAGGTANVYAGRNVILPMVMLPGFIAETRSYVFTGASMLPDMRVELVLAQAPAVVVSNTTSATYSISNVQMNIDVIEMPMNNGRNLIEHALEYTRKLGNVPVVPIYSYYNFRESNGSSGGSLSIKLSANTHLLKKVIWTQRNTTALGTVSAIPNVLDVTLTSANVAAVYGDSKYYQSTRANLSNFWLSLGNHQIPSYQFPGDYGSVFVYSLKGVRGLYNGGCPTMLASDNLLSDGLPYANYNAQQKWAANYNPVIALDDESEGFGDIHSGFNVNQLGGAASQLYLYLNNLDAGITVDCWIQCGSFLQLTPQGPQLVL